MARITLTPLASTTLGSIGSATLSESKGVPYLKRRRTPRDPQSVAQLAHRDAIGQTAPLWRDLMPDLQEAFAMSTTNPMFAGFHVFVSRNWQHLRDSDGLVAPGPTPGVAPEVLIPADMNFSNMWWGPGWGHYDWTDPGQGPDYRTGCFIYDLDTRRLAGQWLNRAAMAAEYATLRIPFPGHNYAFAGFVYRLSDGEIVHCCTDVAIVW